MTKSHKKQTKSTYALANHTCLIQCKNELSITLLRLDDLPYRGLSQKDKWETNTTDTQSNDTVFNTVKNASSGF